MSLDPIPPEVLAECRRLVRMHHGSGMSSADAMLLAATFARGMEHARKLDKDDREAYEAEREEWEAERAAEPMPIAFDVNIKMSDEMIEELKAKFRAAVEKHGTRVMYEAPPLPVFTPWEKLKEEALREERARIRAGSFKMRGPKILGLDYYAVPPELLEEKDDGDTDGEVQPGRTDA